MSEKRIIANRRNARRSTGPRTQAGKARTRLNATKHGGYLTVINDGEDGTRIKRLYLDLLTECQPFGFEETLIVNEIAKVIWRKNRFQAAEAEAIAAYMHGEFGKSNERGDVGFALAQDAGSYGVIPKCLAAEEILDRRLWRLFDRLSRLQKQRGFISGKPASTDLATTVECPLQTKVSVGSEECTDPEI